MIFPLVVTIVAFTFAAILLRQYLRRRRPYQLVWTWSLMLGGVAGLAFVLFLATGRNEALFKLYYIAGALLMAAYLGLGSVYLHASRRVADITAAIVVLVSIVGVVLILGMSVDHSKLQAANVEAGQNLIGGLAVLPIVLLNTFGAVAVIGGAILSAWKLYRGSGPGRLLAANVLIASGTMLASLAGTLARVTGNGSWFWVLLAAGFVILFVGFLLTTVKSAARRSASLDAAPASAATPG